MRRLLALLLTILFLTGCATICPPPIHQAESTPLPEVIIPGADAPARDCVIAQADGNLLLLYDEDGTLYWLDTADLLITTQDESLLSAEALAAGQQVSVFFDGGIRLSYPGFFVEPTKLIVRESSPDLLGLYLNLFDEFWKIDSGINDGISVLAFDFRSNPLCQLPPAPPSTPAPYVQPSESKYALNQAQKNALFYIIESRLGFEAFESDFETLLADGYIVKEESGFCHFPGGLLFEIKVEQEDVNGFQFILSKWRSSLGTILTQGHANCTSNVWDYILDPYAIA